MKNRIQHLLVLILLFPVPFISCQEDPEQDLWVCPDTSYAIQSFERLQLNGASTSATDTLTTDMLSIEFLFEVAKAETSENYQPRKRGSFLITAASALSCVGPHGNEGLLITSLTSNQDFSETYKAGDQLLDNFTSIYTNEVKELLYIEVTGYTDPQEELMGYTSIELVNFPTLADTHVFTIEIQLEEGSTYSVTTAPIRFL